MLAIDQQQHLERYQLCCTFSSGWPSRDKTAPNAGDKGGKGSELPRAGELFQTPFGTNHPVDMVLNSADCCHNALIGDQGIQGANSSTPHLLHLIVCGRTCSG